MDEDFKLSSPYALRPGMAVKEKKDQLLPRTSNFLRPVARPISEIEFRRKQQAQDPPCPEPSAAATRPPTQGSRKLKRNNDEDFFLTSFNIETRAERTIHEDALREESAKPKPTLQFPISKRRSAESSSKPALSGVQVPSKASACVFLDLEPEPPKRPPEIPSSSRSKGKERADGLRMVDGKLVRIDKKTSDDRVSEAPKVTVSKAATNAVSKAATVAVSKAATNTAVIPSFEGRIFSVPFWEKVFDVKDKLEKLGFRATLHQLMTTDEKTYWADHINFKAADRGKTPLNYTPRFPELDEVTWEVLQRCQETCFMHSRVINLFMHMVYVTISKDQRILDKQRFQDVYLDLPSEKDFGSFDESKISKKKSKSEDSLATLQENRGTFIYLPDTVGSFFLNQPRDYPGYVMPFGLPPVTYIFIPAFVGPEYPREDHSTDTSEDGNHFILCEFCLVDASVKVYDSLTSPYKESGRHCAKIYGDKLNYYLPDGPFFWKEAEFPVIPTQKNNNCAAHVMANLGHRILGTPNGGEHCERLRRIMPVLIFAFKFEECDPSMLDM